MIYGICSVLDLIFKDDNSKSGFVYYCFVLGGGLLLVDHCHWDIYCTLIVHDHNMLCLLVCQYRLDIHHYTGVLRVVIQQ